MSHSVISSSLGSVPSSPIEPVTHGRSSGTTALPSSALAHAGAQVVGDRDHFVGRSERTGADQHRHLVARVEHGRSPCEIRLIGHDLRNRVANARVHVPCLREGPGRPFPEVVGQDDCRDRRSPKATRMARSTKWRTCAGEDACWTKRPQRP